MSFEKLPYEIRREIFELARRTAFKDKICRFESVLLTAKSKWEWTRYNGFYVIRPYPKCFVLTPPT